MVARGNQWSPRTNSDAHFKVLRIITTYNGYTGQNVSITSNFPLSSTKSMVARGTNGHQGQTVMHI